MRSVIATVKKLALTPRVSGSANGKNAAKLIATELASAGYEVEMQQFPFVGWRLVKKPIVKINGKKVKCLPLIWSGSGRAKGRIVRAGKMKTYEAYQWLRWKVINKKGKAVAHIISRPDTVWAQPLDEPSKKLYFMVYPETCQMLRDRKTPPVAEVSVKTEFIRGLRIQNVFTKCRADKKIMVCAHYDSVIGARGANDNASGVAALLQIADIFKNKKGNLQFIAFDAEEWNKAGSYAFVRGLTKKELKKILAVVNIDMIGHGKPYIICSPRLKKKVATAVRKSGVHIEKIITDIRAPFDYWPFYRRSVPIVHFGCSPYKFLHSAADTPDKISEAPIKKVIKLATHVIEELS